MVVHMLFFVSACVTHSLVGRLAVLAFEICMTLCVFTFQRSYLHQYKYILHSLVPSIAFPCLSQLIVKIPNEF